MANLSTNISIITFNINIPIKTEVGRVGLKTCLSSSIYEVIELTVVIHKSSHYAVHLKLILYLLCVNDISIKMKEKIKLKHAPTICCLHESHFKYNDRQVKSKRMEKHILCKHSSKESRSTYTNIK